MSVQIEQLLNLFCKNIIRPYGGNSEYYYYTTLFYKGHMMTNVILYVTSLHKVGFLLLCWSLFSKKYDKCLHPKNKALTSCMKTSSLNMTVCDFYIQSTLQTIEKLKNVGHF